MEHTCGMHCSACERTSYLAGRCAYLEALPVRKGTLHKFAWLPTRLTNGRLAWLRNLVIEQKTAVLYNGYVRDYGLAWKTVSIFLSTKPPIDYQALDTARHAHQQAYLDLGLDAPECLKFNYLPGVEMVNDRNGQGMTGQQ